MPSHTPPLFPVPLRVLRTLAELAVMWTVANSGFFFIAEVYGYSVSYNDQPFLFSCYYIVWAVVVLAYYARFFRAWLPQTLVVRTLVFQSLAFAALLYATLYAYTVIPTVTGPVIAPYTDLMLSSWWFFLPKSAEILVQQLLIAVLVGTLYEWQGSLLRVMCIYAVTFGGLHALIYSLVSAPTPYETVMTIAAVGSSLIFPYFLTRVRGGFIHAYAFHLMFYILLALVMHTWPPPEYIQTVL